MIPRLLLNKVRYGRYLDVLVTHAPPRGLGDREDPAHQGFESIKWLLRFARPRYQLHGHIHLYDRTEQSTFVYDRTTIINVYPYQRLELDIPELQNSPHSASSSTSDRVDSEGGVLHDRRPDTLRL